MLTKLTINNFKRFEFIEVELGNQVVFIGPNNSGKTSALQALALWDVGLKRWTEKRKGKKAPEKRPGVTINRRDLVSVPIPDANLLWHALHVRDVKIIKGKQSTKNVRMDIIVEGVTEDKKWKCGLEFDYANQESFYCRPVRLEKDVKNPERMAVPPEAEKVLIAFLPPMSGLAANETRLDSGAINVRVGEGRTAEVLRNLCYEIHRENHKRWDKLVAHISSLFGSELEQPTYVPERGEIVMNYREQGTSLDLSCSGRGLQQTLLLLAYMYANPNSALLLDEPDAHLEILRQRQIYQLLADVARENGNQVIAASHSEVLLNEAAGRDVVIAFVGTTPHRINDTASQVLKSLRDIGFEDYYQSEQTGWVLYLEGSTDLAILRAFAEALGHQEAITALERPFVHYVGNQPNEAAKHYYGLREAARRLSGIAVFDRIEKGIPEGMNANNLKGLMWKRCEIENYFCYPETLDAYAKGVTPEGIDGPLFAQSKQAQRQRAMQESVSEVEEALRTLGKGSPWDRDTKVSDDFLVPLFKKYFKKRALPNIMAKSNFHELARFVPKEKIDREVEDVLDAIADTDKRARPRENQ